MRGSTLALWLVLTCTVPLACEDEEPLSASDAGPATDAGPHDVGSSDVGGDASTTDLGSEDAGAGDGSTGDAGAATYCEAPSDLSSAVSTTLFSTDLASWSQSTHASAVAYPGGFAYVRLGPSFQNWIDLSSGPELNATWSEHGLLGDTYPVELDAEGSTLVSTMGIPESEGIGISTRTLSLTGTVLSTTTFSLPRPQMEPLSVTSTNGLPLALVEDRGAIRLVSATLDVALDAPEIGSSASVTGLISARLGLVATTVREAGTATSSVSLLDLGSSTPPVARELACPSSWPETPSFAWHPLGLVVALECGSGTRLMLLDRSDLSTLRSVELSGAVSVPSRVGVDADGAIVIARQLQTDTGPQLLYLGADLETLRQVAITVPTELRTSLRQELAVSPTVPGSVALFITGSGGHGSGPVGVARVELCASP